MGLFRPYEQGKTEARPAKKAKAADPASAETNEAVGPGSAETIEPDQSAPDTASASEASRQPVKKGAPTRTRAQAEADRMERLHPTLSAKQQRAVSRQSRRDASNRRWDAIEHSDERVLMRDYIDARWTFSEFIMPVVILVMAFSIVALRSLALQQIASIAMLAIFMIWIADNVRLWYGFKRELRSRIPGASTRGLLMVMINRAMTIRRWRRPAPRINRGERY